MKYAEFAKHLPNYITTFEGGEGFSEAAEIILTARENETAKKYNLSR